MKDFTSRQQRLNKGSELNFGQVLLGLILFIIVVLVILYAPQQQEVISQEQTAYCQRLWAEEDSNPTTFVWTQEEWNMCNR